MKAQFRQLRLRQLAKSLEAFEAAKSVVRPKRGWLRAIREALGLTLTEVGKAIAATPSHLQALENSEAHERITLNTLKRVAAAMGCQLVYAIVPQSGTLVETDEKRALREATARVRAVEHTMALEDQAVGGVPEKIEQETRRLLKRS